MAAKWSDVAGIREWTAPFLSEDEKRAAVGSVFRLIYLHYDPENMFGARWIVGVIDVASGNRYTIGLRSNPVRDAQFRAAQKALDAGVEIGPVVFLEVPTRSGQMAYAFADATDDQVNEALNAYLASHNAASIGASDILMIAESEES